jgi:hypothetical protein
MTALCAHFRVPDPGPGEVWAGFRAHRRLAGERRAPRGWGRSHVEDNVSHLAGRCVSGSSEPLWKARHSRNAQIFPKVAHTSCIHSETDSRNSRNSFRRSFHAAQNLPESRHSSRMPSGGGSHRTQHPHGGPHDSMQSFPKVSRFAHLAAQKAAYLFHMLQNSGRGRGRSEAPTSGSAKCFMRFSRSTV